MNNCHRLVWYHLFWLLFTTNVLSSTRNLLAPAVVANPLEGGNPNGHNMDNNIINKNSNDDSEAIKSLESTSLLLHPDCKADIQRICPKTVQSNFDVLNCIQNSNRREAGDLSAKCSHTLWTFKKNVTLDNGYEKYARQECAEFLNKNPDCSHLKSSHLLSCLMEHISTAEDASFECKNFLFVAGMIIFSDYRLIFKFTEDCDKDIDRLQCGRLDLSLEGSVGHLQGQTIDCLEQNENLKKLSTACRNQILRVAEIQSEDFRLDRGLYFACVDDRERFCPRVHFGEGRVIKCLTKHKSDPGMSDSCGKQLMKRQFLAVHDYKVSHSLVRACKEYINKYNCGANTSNKKQIRLSQILLCLENAINSDYAVGDECKGEMLEHRKALMENYQLTPELVNDCHTDIHIFCKDRFGPNTLHCLMEHVRPMAESEFSVAEQQISSKCRNGLFALLKEINAGEDWRVDPLLQQSCQMTANTVCKEVTPGEGRMLRCLMSYLDSTYMTGDCKKSLLQLQYFVSRDFDLDIPLYKSCKEEAVKHCHAHKSWFKDTALMEPDRGPLVMSCLYRRAYHPDKEIALSPQCLIEVRRVMRQRASSIDLLPDIEEPCLNDLARHCSHDAESLTKKGFEMECLQEKLDVLSKDCKAAVFNFTEDEAEFVELNYPLYKYCNFALKKICNEDDLGSDQGELMQCLIDHKNNPIVAKHPKCRAAIEHFQLLSLKDYRFSFKFKQACETDVLKNCPAVRTKFDVVACLSTLVFNDSVSATHKKRVAPECRDQLRVELLERSENILLDPKLRDACESDRKRFCTGISYGAGQALECLKLHMSKLSKTCHKVIFKREKIEMMDNAVDYTLMTTCKQSIKKFCDSSKTSEVLFCLRDHRNNAGMEPYCRKLVLRRLADQNHDYRLNPRLKSFCKEDIKKFCVDVLISAHPDEELDGKVITCLKKQYIKNRLSQTCEIEMVSLIRTISENIELDPHVMNSCADDLRAKCSDEKDLQECLKNKFRKGELSGKSCRKEVALLIAEEKPDIKSDPTLYKACLHEVKIYCSDIPAGHGMQLSCLLDALNMNSKMSDQCLLTLTKRVEMYRFAAQSYADSVGDVVKIMIDSPSRNYFFLIIISFVALLFLMGLLCGRVTKRSSIKKE